MDSDTVYEAEREFVVDVDVLPTVALVRVAGDVDLANADELRGAVAGAGRRVGSPVVLGLGGVTHFDSTGIKVLLELREMLGERLKLHLPSACVSRLLSLTRTRGLFEVVETF